MRHIFHAKRNPPRAGDWTHAAEEEARATHVMGRAAVRVVHVAGDEATHGRAGGAPAPPCAWGGVAGCVAGSVAGKRSRGRRLSAARSGGRRARRGHPGERFRRRSEGIAFGGDVPAANAPGEDAPAPGRQAGTQLVEKGFRAGGRDSSCRRCRRSTLRLGDRKERERLIVRAVVAFAKRHQMLEAGVPHVVVRLVLQVGLAGQDDPAAARFQAVSSNLGLAASSRYTSLVVAVQNQMRPSCSAAKLKGRTWGWSPSQVARYHAGTLVR